VTGSLHFLRVKVPGGLITSDQFRRVAELAAKYSRGQAEITNRQSIQLHWVGAEEAMDAFSVLDDLGFTTDMCGQGFAGTRYGDIRNILCCPASGIEEGEILNGFPLVDQLTEFFIGNPDFLDMPRKFKLSVSGCGNDCTRAQINDLAFVAVRKDAEIGYALLVGGGMGPSLPGPRLARPAGVLILPDDAFDVAVAIAEIHRDHGNRESKAKARFKWLIESWGMDKFVGALEKKLDRRFEPYNGPTFQGRCDHEGVGPQNQKGLRYVNIPILGGRLTRDEMVGIADVAEEFGGGELRLTPTQNVIVPHVLEADILLERLGTMGLRVKGSKVRWNSLGCSSDFCGKTVSPHAKDVLKEVVNQLESSVPLDLLDEAGFRVHINGCPNNCCPSLISGLGLNGRQVQEGGETSQTYDILLGGCYGSETSFGRVVEKNVPLDGLKPILVSLLRNYGEHRTPSEELGSFCRRRSILELRAYLNGEVR
jgi:sulfite reductase beta subunit-like hemoprotein